MPLDPQIRKDVIAILGVVLGNLPPDDRVTFLNARLDGLDLLTHNDCRGDKITVASHVAQRLYEHGLMPDHKPALEVLLRSLLEEGKIGNQWKKKVEGYLKQPGSLYEGGGDTESTRIPEQPQKEPPPAPPSPNSPQPRTAAKRNVSASKKKPAIPDESEPPQADTAPATDAATTPQAATIADKATDAEPATMEPAQPVVEVILLIHGIRTDGYWQQNVANVLQSPKIVVHPIRFNRFLDLFSFWLTFTRRPFIDRVERELDDTARLYPGCKISIVAHSFGTYAVGEVLRKRDNIQLHRLVLCGSILQSDFEWRYIRPRVAKTVLNDCGSRDWWPILAKKLSWGYGDAGTYGFGTVNVRDRFHELRHSDYFKTGFAAEFWKPWFHEDRVADTKWEQERPPTPKLMYLVEVANLKLIIGFSLTFGLGLGLWVWWQFGWGGLLVCLGYLASTVAAAILFYVGAKVLTKSGMVAAMTVLLMFSLWRLFPIDDVPPKPPIAVIASKVEITSEFDADGDLLVAILGLDSLPQSNREFIIVGKVDGGSERELTVRLPALKPTARTLIEFFDLVGTVPGTVSCLITWDSNGVKESASVPVDDKPRELPKSFEKLSDNPETAFLRWLEKISEARLSLLMKERAMASVISKRAARVDLSEFELDTRKLQILFDGMNAADLRLILKLDWQQRPAYRDFDYKLLETDIDKFIKDYEGFADTRARSLLGALQRKKILISSDAFKTVP